MIDLRSHTSYRGGQPHAMFDWLRANDPVHWHADPPGQESGYWALTRHADVVAVGRDPERFSSEPTIMINDAGPADPDHRMMLMADPPLHTTMRRLVNRRFTPRATRDLAPRLAELATRIVDAVAERGSCDLVTDLAGEMPSFVIAEILGIPLEDGRDLYHRTETLHASDDAVGIDAKLTALQEMMAYSAGVYRRKLEHPTDDLASHLASSPMGDRDSDEQDFFLWFLLLVDAGGDTTRNLVGAGFHALFEHDSQLDALRRDPDGVLPGAIEELLRWVSPVVHMRRTATTDTELGGRSIRAGDRVVLYYGAANRDPAVFGQPHRLDLGRSPNPHVAFGGGGPHFCLGAHLARLEIHALVREILVRLPDLEPAGEPTWMASDFVHGPSSLPVRFTPVRAIGGPAAG